MDPVSTPPFLIHIFWPRYFDPNFLFFTGNDDGIFSIDEITGQLFQVKELDFEAAASSRFNLEIQATQKENPLKTALAKVEYLPLKYSFSMSRLGKNLLIWLPF